MELETNIKINGVDYKLEIYQVNEGVIVGFKFDNRIFLDVEVFKKSIDFLANIEEINSHGDSVVLKPLPPDTELKHVDSDIPNVVPKKVPCEKCKEKEGTECVYYSEYESYLCKDCYKKWLKFIKGFSEKDNNQKCEKKYLEWLTKNPVESKLLSKVPILGQDSISKKICSRCKQSKPLSEFNKRYLNGRPGYQNNCRNCGNLYNAKWRTKKSVAKAPDKYGMQLTKWIENKETFDIRDFYVDNPKTPKFEINKTLYDLISKNILLQMSNTTFRVVKEGKK